MEFAFPLETVKEIKNMKVRELKEKLTGITDSIKKRLENAPNIPKPCWNIITEERKKTIMNIEIDINVSDRFSVTEAERIHQEISPTNKTKN